MVPLMQWALKMIQNLSKWAETGRFRSDMVVFGIKFEDESFHKHTSWSHFWSPIKKSQFYDTNTSSIRINSRLRCQIDTFCYFIYLLWNNSSSGFFLQIRKQGEIKALITSTIMSTIFSLFPGFITSNNNQTTNGSTYYVRSVDHYYNRWIAANLPLQVKAGRGKLLL